MIEIDLATVNKPKHSHSRHMLYLRCARLYLLSAMYENIIPDINLVVGSGVHGGLAEWHLSKNKTAALKAMEVTLKEQHIVNDDFYDLANGICFDILVAYFEKYKYDDVNFVVTETPFEEEIKPGYWFRGIIDGVVASNNLHYIGEHKTSGWNAPAFWEQISRSKQLTTYYWAGKKLFPEFTLGGYFLNVLFKPSARKQADFKRVYEAIESWKVIDWEIETCNIIDNINFNWNKGSHAFPQSQNRCRDYNRKCEFWDFCEGNCNPKILKTTHKLIPLKESV